MVCSSTYEWLLIDVAANDFNEIIEGYKEINNGLKPNFLNIDILVFDGANARSWVRKCEKFFQLNGFGKENKIEIASVYFSKRVNMWFQGWLVSNGNSNWDEFVEDLMIRFGKKG